MIITVASGKGGTGKTTVAVNLAVIASESIGIRRTHERVVELFDCDVEEPNAHLFVKPNSIVSEEIFTMIPEIESNLCNLCGECEKICRFSAITLIAKKIMVFPEMCHSCKGCWMVCPTGAVQEGKRSIGSLHIGDSEQGFTLTWGELKVGEPMSPPLIKQVKSKIYPQQQSTTGKNLVKQLQSTNNLINPLFNISSESRIDKDVDVDVIIDKISIVDAPPGTSCPAVTTLKDSDFVLLVAEETPFGLNDLSLTVEVLKKLNIPMGIVINRASVDKNSSCCGVNDTKPFDVGIIDDYANKEKIEIMQRIPFSRQAAAICSKGLLLVKELPEMKQLFEELYIKIINKLKPKIEANKANPIISAEIKPLPQAIA